MLAAQSWPTLCDPMVYSPPGSSVLGILQARTLQWGTIPFSRGSSWSKDRTESPTLQADSLPSEPAGKGRSFQVFSGLSLELTECHHCCSFWWKQVTGPAQIQGEGTPEGWCGSLGATNPMRLPFIHSSPATQASVLFFKHTMHTPAAGPLHLFPSLRIPFTQYPQGTHTTPPFSLSLNATLVEKPLSKTTYPCLLPLCPYLTLFFFLYSLLPVMGFPAGASGKEPACQCRKHKRSRFHPWVRKIPWRRKWLPTPVFLPGKSHGQRSLAGYSPRGCKESDTTEWVERTHTSWHIYCMCVVWSCSAPSLGYKCCVSQMFTVFTSVSLAPHLMHDRYTWWMSSFLGWGNWSSESFK